MTLEQRVDRIESRFAIQSLSTRYAIACDDHDIDSLASLFAPDAEFDTPTGVMKARGREQIRQMFIGLLRSRGPGFHWTHDHLIDFDQDHADRASGLVLSHAEVTPSKLVCQAGMRYRDDYVRLDGTWLFQRRVLSLLYYLPSKDFPTGLAEPDRVRSGGGRRTGDFPETMPCWQEFESRFGVVT